MTIKNLVVKNARRNFVAQNNEIMKNIFALFVVIFMAFHPANFINPLDDDTNTAIIFTGVGSGAGHLVLMCPEGYYSVVTQALQNTFNDYEPTNNIAVKMDV